MKKVYRANSLVSMTLNMNGIPFRVRFRPVTNYMPGVRGSVYETSSEEVQRLLESHGGYGTMFYLDEDDSDKPIENSADVPAENKEPEVKMRVVKVESLADAKSWLVENKNWTPKNRVTKKGLVDIAAEYGVVFEGLE